uniref:Putative secreted protein n=1 Tax=Anopheles marajoara TaxID=58244 RepID=A0A2M4CEF3_9DIPT
MRIAPFIVTMLLLALQKKMPHILKNLLKVRLYKSQRAHYLTPYQKKSSVQKSKGVVALARTWRIFKHRVL